MLQNLIDIIAAPNAAFNRLKEQPTFLLPLALLILSTVAATAGYMLLNDEGFVRDQIMEQAIGNREMTAEQRRAVEQQIGSVSLQTQAIVSSAAVAIFVPLITALYAGYLVLMNKLSSRSFSFKHWFSLASWTGIPGAIAALVSLIVLLTDANGQVSQAEMQPLSITGLLGIETTSQALKQVNLMTIWALVLVALGYQNWTGKGIATSIAITWIPYILIYGGIAIASL